MGTERAKEGDVTKKGNEVEVEQPMRLWEIVTYHAVSRQMSPAVGVPAKSISELYANAWMLTGTCTAKHQVIRPTSSRRLPAATARAGLTSAPSGSAAVPRTTSSLGDRSFAVAAPRAWNNLPSPLRRVDSVNIFKRQLKTFLPGFLTFWFFSFYSVHTVSALVVFAHLRRRNFDFLIWYDMIWVVVLNSRAGTGRAQFSAIWFLLVWFCSS